MEVYVIYNDDNQLQRIKDSEFKLNPFFHFMDYRIYKERKNAFKIMGHFASKKPPFVGIYDDSGKALKGFYSEASNDVINDLINYLKNE